MGVIAREMGWAEKEAADFGKKFNRSTTTHAHTHTHTHTHTHAYSVSFSFSLSHARCMRGLPPLFTCRFSSVFKPSPSERKN